MYFLWPKGLPNHSQGRYVIPTSLAGGVEMWPGRVHKFEGPVAEAISNIPWVLKLEDDDPRVIEAGFVEVPEVKLDAKKTKTLISPNAAEYDAEYEAKVKENVDAMKDVKGVLTNSS